MKTRYDSGVTFHYNLLCTQINIITCTDNIHILTKRTIAVASSIIYLGLEIYVLITSSYSYFYNLSFIHTAIKKV